MLEILKKFILNCAIGSVILACNPLGDTSTTDDTFGLDETQSSSSWIFNDESKFYYDINEIEFKNGEALNKESTFLYEGSEFVLGAHSGTVVSQDALTLDVQKKNKEIHPSWTPAYSSIVAHYPFDSSWVETINGHNATTTNASFSSESQVGGASASLVSSTANIANTANLNFDPTTDFTLGFWIKSSGGSGNILGWSQGAAFFTILFDAGRVRVRIRDSSSVLVNSYHGTVGGLNDDQWHQVILSVDQDSAVNVYVDGAKLGNSLDISGLGDFSGTGGYQLGAGYNGLLDDLIIWRGVALNSYQAANMYQGQLGNILPDTSMDSSWAPKWNDLVGYWKMDGDWMDSSGNGQHGQAIGDATFSNDKKVGSQAGSFDGSGDYIDLGVADFSGTNEGTLSAWVKTIDSNGNSRLLLFGNSNDRASLLVRNSKISLYVMGAATSVCVSFTDGLMSNSVVSDGKWHHVAGTFSSSGARIYFDGKLENQDNTDCSMNTMSSTSPLYISRYISSGYEIDAELDDAAIWTKALTEAEISLIYHRQKQKYAGSYESPVIDAGSSKDWRKLAWGTTIPFLKEMPGSNGSETSAAYSALATDDLMNGLWGLWHLNGPAWSGVANEVIDSSGAGLHGYAGSGALVSGQGRFLEAAQLDGVNDSIILDAHAASAGGYANGTLSLWFKADGTSSDQTLFSLSEGAGSDSHVLLLLGDYTSAISNESLTFNVKSGGSYELVMTLFEGHEKYLDNKWHHVVVRVDGVDNSLFVDGQKKTANFASGNVSTSQFFNINNPTHLRLGNRVRNGGNEWYFEGKLDEVAIWTRGLQDDEIVQIYRRGANRVKFQVRSCDDALCSGETWRGADEAGQRFSFSELNNCDLLTGNGDCDFVNGGLLNLNSPDLLFTDFTNLTLSSNRYFQYRVLLESDDESSTPVLPTVSSVNLGEKYAAGNLALVTESGHSFTAWSGFDAVTTGTCSVKFQFSLDKSSWFYFDGSSWSSVSSLLDANTSGEVTLAAKTFAQDVGVGTLYMKTVLSADSNSSCGIKSVTLDLN